MKSFFFIPGDHPKLEEKVRSIDADHLVIDLEDAIHANKLSEAARKVQTLNDKSVFVRPRLEGRVDGQDATFIDLLNAGFRNFVIPKFQTAADLAEVERALRKRVIFDEQIVLLIENPRALINLQKILSETKLNVIGLAFGSQDFCAESNMKHDETTLLVPRFMIACMASMFELMAIDIACMDIFNDQRFASELEAAKGLGYDAKFAIHPRQLSIMKKTSLEVRDYEEAQKVVAEYERLNSPAVFVFNGQVIEPPHIKKLYKILNRDGK